MAVITSLSNELINKEWSVKLPSGIKTLVIPDYINEVIIFEETTELGSYEVFADGILSKNQAEAATKIDKSSLFNDKEKLIATIEPTIPSNFGIEEL